MQTMAANIVPLGRADGNQLFPYHLFKIVADHR